MGFSSISGSTSKRFLQFYRWNGEELNPLYYPSFPLLDFLFYHEVT